VSRPPSVSRQFGNITDATVAQQRIRTEESHNEARVEHMNDDSC